MKSLFHIIFIISFLVAIGFTIAYFSDTERSENNVFSAGTLDLSIDEPVNAVWQTRNWMPGDELEGELEFKNDGSLPINSLIMTVEIQ
ncbi:MAG: TasA family protein [Candidatus Gottesmanbacteria bacterium]